jgi:predicted N-formylglutamate amidohydrolase
MPTPPAASLLSPKDPAPVEWIDRDAPAPVLLTCDHASRAVPAVLASLGLDAATLAQHIGWDIGAAAVTRALAPLLQAPAILSGYSRLVIDCNRDPDDPSSIPATSDGVIIPGNRDLAAAARAARRDGIFAPYHAAVAGWIERQSAPDFVPALLSIHSFTPEMNGVARPWHIGILWDEDPRLPLPLLEALSAQPDLVVGDNQPYSAREPAGYTVRHHAERLGLPHVAIELRQDLIADAAGAARWAGRLHKVLAPLLGQRGLYQRWAPAVAPGNPGARAPQ